MSGQLFDFKLVDEDKIDHDQKVFRDMLWYGQF